MIDAHCHLDDPRFDGDREAMLARARAVGVHAMIIPGVTRIDWPRVRAVAASGTGLHPCYGIHPLFVDPHHRSDLDELADWVQCNPTVAIGECGLDYYHADRKPTQQHDCFAGQLELAAAFGLPVVIHARKALDQVLALLRRRPGLTGMVHSYSGSLQQTRQLLDLGFYISLGGSLTYEQARRLRELARWLPLDRVLVETDAPDQAGVSHRGERNEPAYLTEVVATLAELRGQSVTTVAKATSVNAAKLFGLPMPADVAVQIVPD